IVLGQWTLHTIRTPTPVVARKNRPPRKSPRGGSARNRGRPSDNSRTAGFATRPAASTSHCLTRLGVPTRAGPTSFETGPLAGAKKPKKTALPGESRFFRVFSESSFYAEE